MSDTAVKLPRTIQNKSHLFVLLCPFQNDINEPGHRIVVFIAFADMSLINTHADISSEA